jgi:hypothetical protein
MRVAVEALVGGEGRARVGYFGGVAGSRHNPPFPPQPEVCEWRGESDCSARQLEFGAAEEAAKRRWTTCWKWSR